jgi:hypothetical protein
MPSRALATKAVLCATNSRPGTGLRPRTIVAYSSHGSIRLASASASTSTSALRHHPHHNLTPMDDNILAKLFSNNSQWAKAVTETDPDFFERSVREGQHPKVRFFLLKLAASSSHTPTRFSGLDVPTPVSPKASSLPRPQASSSSIAISPSKSRNFPPLWPPLTLAPCLQPDPPA